MDKITFSNKVDTKITSVAEINKVTGGNLNEIKNVANLTVDQLELNTAQINSNLSQLELNTTKIASNKEDIASLINGNGKTYISISDAMAVLPLPSDNTPFTIRDSISNLEDGYYIYLSTEVGGYKFLEALEALANGYYIVNSLLDFDSLITNVTGGVWMVISDITLDANKTIPAGVTLQFRNAKINLGGFNLTGTNTKIDAGLTQIFDTNGNLTGSWGLNKAYPQWFGGVFNGVNDDSLYLQKAINFINLVGGGVVDIEGLNIGISTSIALKQRVFLTGGSFKKVRQTVDSGIGVNGDTPNGVISVNFGNNSQLQAESAIIFETYTEINNILFTYPDQLETLLEPINFPPTISPLNGFTQYNGISGLTFHGATEWIRVDSGFGGVIENIQGAVLKLGINITNGISPITIRDVFGSPSFGEIGSNLKNYSIANGVLFNVDYADDLTITNCNAVNLGGFITCNNYTNRPPDSFGTRTGGMWGRITDCLADICVNPIVINDADTINITNMVAVCNTLLSFRGGDGILINSLETNGASVSVIGGFFKNMSNGIHVKAANGSVNVVGVNAEVRYNLPLASRYGNLSLQNMIVVNENNGARVSVSGLPFAKDAMTYVMGEMTVDGLSYANETLSTDITPSGIMDKSNWIGDLTNVTQIDLDTLDFNLGNSALDVYFGLPNEIDNTQGAYILKYDIELFKDEEVGSDIQFNLDVRINSSVVLMKLNESGFYPNFTPRIDTSKMFFLPDNTPGRLNVRFGRTGANSATNLKVRLKNIKIVLADRTQVSQGLIDRLYGTTSYLVTSFNKFFGINSLGYRMTQSTVIPSNTSYSQSGDKSFNTSATTSGDVEYWLFNGTSWVVGNQLP